MEGDPETVPVDALEDVAYLARSPNRVRLLDVLASGAYTRRTLDDATGIPRTTIGRIVNEFEERGWAERTRDGTYTATPTGEQVVAEFRPLVESMVAIRKLGDLVSWLQATDESIHLQHFSDVTIRRPLSADPVAPTEYYADSFRAADECHLLTGVAPPISVEVVMRDEVVDREVRVEHVISAGEFEYLSEHPERLPRWREYVRGGANVYRYDGEVPCNLFVFDDTVYIANSQSEYGEPYALIESSDRVVRAWARDVIERHRADARRLDAETFDVR